VSRSRWPWVALAALVVVMVVVLVARSRPDNSPSARVNRLEHELACPICEGQSVADSNSLEAQGIRVEIPQLVAQGKTDAQIRAYYVARYGDKMQEIPDDSGIGLVVWLVPAIALILGLGGIALLLRRWSRTPRLHATPEDEELVQHARHEREDSA